jgi:phosphoglycerate dehydrogenase-like enzyme
MPATSIAVCSRSFSRNPILRAELEAQYRNVKFNDEGLELKGNSLVAFLKGHEKAITALEKLDDFVLSQLPDLKVIGKYGVGLDMIDMDAMRKYKIRLGWEGGVNRRGVSELVLAFILSMLREIPAANRQVMKGTWRQHTGIQLTGKTVGIIGCGHVGQDLVALLAPFNCTILVYDIETYSDFYAANNIKATSLNELLMQSDVVTLHTPLDDSTRNIINKSNMSLMKKSAILINVARGGVVDELALKKALITNTIAGAAFDVFTQEPPADTELLNLPNFLATPHIGGSSKEAVLAMGRAAIKGLSVNAFV